MISQLQDNYRRRRKSFRRERHNSAHDLATLGIITSSLSQRPINRMAAKGKSSKSKPSFAKASKSSKAATATPSDVPPAPFTRAPSSLEPLLSQLSTRHVYITHIDSTPWDFKRKIFIVPVLMNVAIILLLLWRIYIIAPFYVKVCLSLMAGQHNDTTLDTADTPVKELGWEVAQRMVLFCVDFLLYAFIWPWPRDFFAGRKDGSPTAWRMTVGFQDKEIVVRRSRKWDQEIGDVVTPAGQGDEGKQLFLTNIRQAVAPAWMHEKTGYLMMNKEWDLDWRAMVGATSLVTKKELSLEDLGTTILVYSQTFGWTVFEARDIEGNTQEEVGRKKIIAFKDELTAMGKENLFFKWIELIQWESAQPGGFTPDRQADSMAKAKEMFEAQGVDFEDFWRKVGGMEGMPGMDQP